MTYLVCPEESKWFLAKAENFDELFSKNPLFDKLEEAGKCAVAISLEGEYDEVAFFAPDSMPTDEVDEIVNFLRYFKFYDRPLTANQALALVAFLTCADVDVEEDT